MSKFKSYRKPGYVGYGMYAQPNEAVIMTKVLCTTLFILWAVITLLTTGMMIATDSIMWCIVSAMCGASTVFSAFAFKGLVHVAENMASLTDSMPVMYPMD